MGTFFVFVKGTKILGRGGSIAELAARLGTAKLPRVFKVFSPVAVPDDGLYVRDARLRLREGLDGWVLPYGRYTPAMSDDYPPLSGAGLAALFKLEERSQILGVGVRHATGLFLERAGLAKIEVVSDHLMKLLVITPPGRQYAYRLRKGLP